jgi:hypothetical protein
VIQRRALFSTNSCVCRCIFSASSYLPWLSSMTARLFMLSTYAWPIPLQSILVLLIHYNADASRDMIIEERLNPVDLPVLLKDLYVNIVIQTALSRRRHCSSFTITSWPFCIAHESGVRPYSSIVFASTTSPLNSSTSRLYTAGSCSEMYQVC